MLTLDSEELRAEVHSLLARQLEVLEFSARCASDSRRTARIRSKKTSHLWSV